MAYDRADWHSGGNYPEGLPPENGGTHIGMFLAWVIINYLEGDELRECATESIQRVRTRQMTGREFFLKECDGKLWDVDLNDACNGFAKYYYSTPDFLYLKDYEREFKLDAPTIYHIDDIWANYERIAAVISRRYEEWRTSQTLSNV
jgi:hypothetical protein